MPEVVRRERRDTGRLAGPDDRHAKPGVGDAGEQRRVEVAILPRRQGRLDRVGEGRPADLLLALVHAFSVVSGTNRPIF
jgi:hypothetical protein